MALPGVQKSADVRFATTGNGSAASCSVDQWYAASFEDRASLFISVLPYAGEQKIKGKSKSKDTEMCGDSVGLVYATPAAHS